MVIIDLRRLEPFHLHFSVTMRIKQALAMHNTRFDPSSLRPQFPQVNSIGARSGFDYPV